MIFDIILLRFGSLREPKSCKMNDILNKISIIRGTEKDLESIQTCQKNDGFPHVYYLTKDRIETLLKRGEIFFIAYIDGQPVGMCSFDPEVRSTLHLLSVDTKYQNKGVGSLLMNTMLDENKKLGYKAVFTFVEANSIKEEFLRNCSFHQVGYFKDRYAPGKDATIWSKILA